MSTADLLSLRHRLHPSHAPRVARLLDEVETLDRWAAFAERYRAEAEGTPHGERLALRERLGAEFGMDEREQRRALYGG